MESPVETIKARLNIVDVVGSYVKLEKAGTSFKARCPFHSERTPSFAVSPVRQTYHCFGCSKGGDIFSFVQEMEGVTFKESLELLATRAGVVLPKSVSTEVSSLKRLYAVMEEAVTFYENALKQNPKALEYLKSRGITDKTINSFRIGYAPDEWSTLYTRLRSQGFVDSEIERAGLGIKGKQEGLYDRFRGRIMFPIANAQGAPVAFSGRIDPILQKPDSAKYVNSPETELYNKSRILYGYADAKRSILKAGHAIIVEGQMDLVLAHQAGTTNTIAVSGTAFTESHAESIIRFTQQIKICFDGDSAGFSAFERAAKILIAKGCMLKVVPLAKGTDPADIIRDDPKEWIRLLGESVSIVSFYVTQLTEENPDRTQLIRAIEGRLLPLVASVASPLVQDRMIKDISEQTGATETALRSSLSKISFGGGEIEKSTSVEHIKRQPILEVESRIIGFVGWYEQKYKNEDKKDIITELENRFKDLAGGISSTMNVDSDAERDALIFEAEMYYDHIEKPETILQDLVDSYEQLICEDELAHTLLDLKKAENQGTMDGIVDSLVLRCHELTARINRLKSKPRL